MHARSARILALSALLLLLAATPALAGHGSAGVARYPAGKRVGSVAASAVPTASGDVRVRVRVALRAPAGRWRVGVLVSLLCDDAAVSGESRTLRLAARRGVTAHLTTRLAVPAIRCSGTQRVVASVLVSRRARAATWARGQVGVRVG